MPATPTVFASGTQTAIIGTEHTLSAPTGAGIFVLRVDVTNMAAGDMLEVRLKTKVLTGGVVGVVYLSTFANAPSADNVIQVSVPIPVAFGATATLKQTQGTGRNYDWDLLQM